MGLEQNRDAGIYCRLSVDDERTGESVSIENQKLLLQKYVKDQGWNEVEVYCDDGYSGTNFDRPAVQRMIEDAKSGRINIIVVKDLSRFGRNYIEIGQFTDYLFPQIGCRFIALGNGIDTISQSSNNDMMGFLNLFNEFYARDTSKKVRAVRKACAENGKFMGTYAPLGYRKDPQDKHRLIIDEEIAPLTRRIFDLRGSGMGFYAIAKLLNEEGILPPGDLYYQRKGKPNPNSMVDIEILFSALINLPRPVPVEILCELCSISPDTLMSISVECRRGFYIADSFIFLKDEDFETYLRTCYENNENAIKLIADYMYKNKTINPYCARYLHIFMDKADYFDCLIQIALNEKFDNVGIGIADTNQIMKQRIKYALKRHEMYAPQNHLLACKLVYRLIDYNAKEGALKELLLSAPDEAVMYCDELSVYNIFHTDSNDFDSLGKAALVFSHLPIYKSISHQYIKSYLAAIKVYYNKNKDDRGFRSRPETTNITNVAEAMLRLGEIDKAVDLICGWNPRIAATKFVYELFTKLLKYNYSELFEVLLLQKWSSPNKLAIVCAYVSLGKTPPKSYIDYLLKLFNRMKAIPESRFSRKQLLMFAEYILHIEDAKNVVSDLINKFSVEFQFSSVPSLYMEDEQEELSDALRYYALSHVCKGTSTNSADFWKAKANLEQSQSEDIKKSIIQIVDFLLPLYVFRLTCIQKKEDGNFLTVCNEILSKIDRSSWSFHSYDKHKLLEIGLLVFTESICLEQSLNPKEIKGLIDKTLNLGNTSPQFKLESLRKLICNERAFQAGLVVLEEINATYEKYPTSAKEMAEVYLSCAQMGQRIDNGLGAKYFAKAIECTKGLDYESYRKIYLYKTLADKIQKDDTSIEMNIMVVVQAISYLDSYLSGELNKMVEKEAQELNSTIKSEEI